MFKTLTLSTLFVASTLLQTQAVNITTSEAVDFVAGVIDGVILKDNLKEIKQCITNVDTVKSEVETIINGFESLTVIGITEAIETFAKLASEVPVDFQQCEGIRPDLDRFKLWAEIFLHPTDLETRLVTNLPAHLNEIMADVEEAQLDISNGNFFDAGENFGEVLVLAVGQVTQTLQASTQ